MKKYFFFLFAIASVSLNAQGISDGLRYSLNENLGNARFSGMSGAMGALGGNTSAMEINPAGGGVFLYSNFTFTAMVDNYVNQSTYFSNQEKDNHSFFDLGNIGGAFVMDNTDENAAFRKLTIGVAYNRTNNFNNEIYFSGRGTTSMGDFFTNQAQGYSMDLFDLRSGESISSLYQYLGENYGTSAQNAFLGYQGYLFDPMDFDDPQNSTYISNVTGNSFDQQYLGSTRGFQGKFTLNFSTQLYEDFYLGMNLNTHTIDYRRKDAAVERNKDPEAYIQAIGFENQVNAYGSGISLQLGGIAKIAEAWRLGLSYETPTWFQITEETSQFLQTERLENDRIVATTVNPRIVNIYEDYRLRTPSRTTVSAAYIFKHYGLLSVDYSYKNYSNIKYAPRNDAYFQALNQAISNDLQAASRVNVGGEYRINQLSFRGGFHFEESPYKDKEQLDDRFGFSIGTGYNFGFLSVDFAYLRSEQKGMTDASASALPVNSQINAIENNFVLSFGLNF